MDVHLAQCMTEAPHHSNHVNHDNQHTVVTSSHNIPTSNPTINMPSQPTHQIQNTFIHLPVSMATSDDLHDNLPPLDAMKMERIAMPTGPSIGMATDPGITTASAQSAVNVDSKSHAKHSQSGIAKDIPVEDLEFDGNTVLCRVCGDKASGFHYGVHACEGCKGFFRRSIQQKIQYRPCLKNQMCNIMRVNRNRCQYCRLRKCIAVGMSRDAVRFGRVPKREKAKIMEQMQKVNAQLQGTLLNDALGDPTDVTERVIAAHTQYCQFTRTKFAALFEKAWEKPKFVDCPAHMACPLSPAPDQSEGMQKWDEFSNCFTPAIRNIVNFAKSIPGFSVFSQEDQVTLLKAGTFEVLLVHLACLFDTQTNTMMFTNGKLFRKLPQQGNTSAGFLLDSMFDFADRLNQLCLTDHEVALFSSLVITAPDRPGLRYHDQVQKVHAVLSHGLQKVMKANHPEEPAAFSKLLMKLPDLRTLNTLHSEKLLGLTVPQNGSLQNGEEASQVLPPSGAVSNQEVSLEPKVEPCLIRSKSPVYPDQTPGSYPVAPYQMPMMRCPVNGTDTLGHGAVPTQFMAGPRPPICPIVAGPRPPVHPVVPHQVSVDPKDKELILQTPFGSFHRQMAHPYGQFDPAMAAMMNMEAELNSAAGRKPDNPLNHVSPMTTVAKATNVSEQNLKSQNTESAHHQAKSISCNSPDDFIDIDIQHSKSANQKPDLRHMIGKLDVRRMMLDPSMPETYRKRLLESIDPAMTEGCRKRLLENIECEVDPKIAKLWEYDMRSSRSNSLSSSSSMESTDSAYRTISNPGTPRSHYEMVRSPYANPTDVSSRISTHTVTTQSTLPRVAEENSDGHYETKDVEVEPPISDGTLPTLRKMLLAAQSTDTEKGKEFREDGESKMTDSMEDVSGSLDEHYFLHKKLKMKQSLLSERNKDNGEFRMRASSFSTVVGQMRQRVVPTFVKPRAVEAPPRLTTKSPTKVTSGVTTSDSATTDATKTEERPAVCKDGTGSGSKLPDIRATATFAAIVSRVMEAALSRDEDDEMEQDREDEQPTVSTVQTTTDTTPVILDNGVSRSSSNNISSSDPPKVTVPSITTSAIVGEKSTTNNVLNKTTLSQASKVSIPVSNKYTLSNPSQRHPELLSRLTAGPKVNPMHMAVPRRWDRGEVLERSMTPPPRLYPIQDNMRGVYLDHSPPSLQAITRTRPRSNTIQSIMRRGSPESGNNHLTAINSLKDKILKRIDSQENVNVSPEQASWPTPVGPEQPPPLCPEQQHSTSHHTPAQQEHCIPQAANTHALPNVTSRKRSHPAYHSSPKPRPSSSSPSNALNSSGQHMMSQYPPPNGSMPMPLPPNSVGFFPGGPLPPTMHPALLFNSAVQFQALQQLHAQAAHIQHQMAHISNLAAMSAINPNPATMESNVAKINHSGDDHHDNRLMTSAPHSQHPANHRLDGEPMNLTVDPGSLRQMSHIKPEPLS